MFKNFKSTTVVSGTSVRLLREIDEKFANTLSRLILAYGKNEENINKSATRLVSALLAKSLISAIAADTIFEEIANWTVGLTAANAGWELYKTMKIASKIPEEEVLKLIAELEDENLSDLID